VSIPSSVVKELWRQGFTLQEAADRAASPELIAQLDKLWPKFDQDAAKAIPFDGGMLQKALAVAANVAISVKPAFDHAQNRAEIRAAIRENLLDLIWNGTAIAVGYAMPRKSSDFPSEIPIDIWEGEINWENSAVRGNGLEFTGVRIVSRKLLEKYIANFNVSENPLPQIAPPKIENNPTNRRRWNAKARIAEAFDALFKAGKIDLLRDKSANYPIIRNWLAEKHPDMRAVIQNLADETIRQATKPLFDRAKGSAPQ
jgi:hypothetical protein